MHYELLRRSKNNKEKAHFLESLCVSFFAAMLLTFKQNHEEHQEKGADFINVVIDKIKRTIEVKNWKTWYLDKKLHIWRPAYISYEILEKIIFDRFLVSDPEHLTQWTLIISFFDSNEPRVWQLVEDFDLQIVVTGVQVLDDTTSMTALSNIRKALYINNKKEGEVCNEKEYYEECVEHDYNGVVDYPSVYQREFIREFLYPS